jgi:hypothetical protein
MATTSSSPTRKKGTAESTFHSRDSKRLENGNALTSRKSFQNLRQLFKLPARVLTPFLNKREDDRGRAPTGKQIEPKAHRLMGEISPTRARALPSSSKTAPNLRKFAARNASTTVPPSPLRNVSEPIPSFPQPGYSFQPTPSGLRSTYTMNQLSPPRQRLPKYSLHSEAEVETSTISSARRAFTDITRRINSPQLHLSRLSLGPRNVSSPLITVPYTSCPTTSASQQTSPPHPVFTNSKGPPHRAQHSLSVLNEVNKRNTSGSGRPQTTTAKEDLATKNSFSKSASSFIQASGPTTASTAPATPPQALFTTNPRCIYNAQPHAYWAGRFTSLHDQYHTQMLDDIVNDEKLLTYFLNPPKGDNKLRQREGQREERIASSGTVFYVRGGGPPDAATRQDEIRRCKRVFYTLQGLCVTPEAKNSLWGFQLRFARERQMEACLPNGGTLEPEKGLKPWTRLANRRRSNTTSSSGLGETF